MRRSAHRLLSACILGFALMLPGCQPSTPVTGTPAPTVAPEELIRGTVLDADGKPAANILVRGMAASDTEPAIVATSGTDVPTTAETHTAADGTFMLAAEASLSINVEAVGSDTLKAIAMEVHPGGDALTLRMAPVGQITGRITSALGSSPELGGGDVYVPGTGYTAVTAPSGAFTITGVAAGTFRIVGRHTDWGQGVKTDLTVATGGVTQAGDLPLTVQPPSLTSVTPSTGAPGQTIVLGGEHLGSAVGNRPAVTINGMTATVFEATNYRVVVGVPAGATNGPLVLKLGALTSNSMAFRVLQRIDVVPDYLASALSDAAATLPTQDFLQVQTPRTFRIRGIDTAGAPVVDPAVTWSTSDTINVSLVDGTATPLSLTTFVMSAHAGNLTSAPLTVNTVDTLAALEVGPDDPPVLSPAPTGVSVGTNPVANLPDSVQLTVSHRYANGGQTTLPVRWSSDTPDKVTVSASGLVHAVPGAEDGTASVTVRSVANPALFAHYEVQLQRQGGFDVEIQ